MTSIWGIKRSLGRSWFVTVFLGPLKVEVFNIRFFSFKLLVKKTTVEVGRVFTKWKRRRFATEHHNPGDSK